MSRGGIASFYSRKNILLTGATGFLGHLITEKLLRSCSGLQTLYLLVRPKDGQTSQERIESMLTEKFFVRARAVLGDELEGKVVGVSGDCGEPGLGLGEEDRALLKKEVHIVIHTAASINMKENLKRSIRTNFIGTQETVRLAKEMDNLQAFAYVSTAYAPCEEKLIEEKFYEPPVTYQALEAIHQNFDEKTCEKVSPSVRKEKANNYLAVKSVTEDFVRQEMKGLPACVFRPSVISATVDEPTPGWMLNLLSVCGVMVHSYRGAVATVCVDSAKTQSLIPVDMTANAILAALYDLGASKGDKGIPVYNFVTSQDNQITSAELHKYCSKYFYTYPTTKAISYPSFMTTSNYLWFRFLHAFRDVLPAIIKDIPSIFLFRVGRNLRRVIFVEYFMDSLRYFMLNDWKFSNSNVQRLWDSLSSEDKKEFNFDMRTVNWDQYTKDLIIGARVHLLNDPLDTLNKARKKYKRLYYKRIILRCILVAMLGQSVYTYYEITSVLAGRRFGAEDSVSEGLEQTIYFSSI